MPVVAWVALGGAIGSAARYGVNVWSGRVLGADFPWATLAVNVIGCFAMGLLIELMALKLNVSLETRAFLTTGILGGFTTFSAFSLDFALLVERKSFRKTQNRRGGVLWPLMSTLCSGRSTSTSIPLPPTNC